MIHPHCRERGHNWDNWRWMPADSAGREAKVDYDTYSFPDGNAGTYFYKRECQNSGCDAVERAERLMAVGTSAIIDTHKSENLR